MHFPQRKYAVKVRAEFFFERSREGSGSKKLAGWAVSFEGDWRNGKDERRRYADVSQAAAE